MALSLYLDKPFAKGLETAPPKKGRIIVASFTKKTTNRRNRRQKNAGRTRKNRQAKRSTLSAAELFARCGEPGQPAPSGTTENAE